MNSSYKVKKNDKVVIFGHKGLIGSALLRELKLRKYKNIITPPKRTLNLLNVTKVDKFFSKNRPKVVLIAAARVGGIHANSTYPFNFLYENMVIQNNIISSSIKFSSKKLIFLGSSCIYPKLWKKPFTEKDLSLNALEKTNEAYSIAKISGLKLCEAFNKQYNNHKPKFLTIIPPNLFGPNDNYDDKNSHVLAALLKKFFYAKKLNKKKIEIWGTGKPKREFLHSYDAAKLIVDLMEVSENKIYKHTQGKFSHINIGNGFDLKISDIANKLRKISNFEGKIVYEKKFPDGVKRKLLDISLLKKIIPKSINKKNINLKKFDMDLKKEYENINTKTFKKFEKNSSYNLPF